MKTSRLCLGRHAKSLPKAQDTLSLSYQEVGDGAEACLRHFAVVAVEALVLHCLAPFIELGECRDWDHRLILPCRYLISSLPAHDVS